MSAWMSVFDGVLRGVSQESFGRQSLRAIVLLLLPASFAISLFLYLFPQMSLFLSASFALSMRVWCT